MINLADKGKWHLAFRTRNKVEEIYYIVCLEPEDYKQFLQDFNSDGGFNLNERAILRFFDNLGLDIRKKIKD